MALPGAFDPSVDHDNPENDRFTTQWSGPLDPRALAHAAEKGISYDHGGGGFTYCLPGSGAHMTLGGMGGGMGGGGINLAKLYRANQGHDNEVREKHAHDITLTSGEGFASKRVKESQTLRKAKAESDLAKNPASPEYLKELDIVNATLECLDRMVLHIDRLNKMVLDELDPDWD